MFAWRGTNPLTFSTGTSLGCSRPEDLAGQGSNMRGAVDHTSQDCSLAKEDSDHGMRTEREDGDLYQ